MIDKSKQYETRDGREVRIYATDGAGDYPIHGSILSMSGWLCTNWSTDGRQNVHYESRDDLIEVKPRIKRTVWMNVYRHIESVYHSKEAADCYAEPERLACIPIEIDVEDKS